tara:strand:+ start:6430 stop:7251 length:822 start_codon:yes stop_codon:yes gene_type:complete
MTNRNKSVFNIFLTGGTSYLGRNLIEKTNNVNFYALQHKNKLEEKENLFIVKNEPKNYHIFFKDNNISHVIHLASSSSEDVEKVIKTNINLGFNLLNSALKTRVEKIIFAGSYFQDIYKKNQDFYTLTKDYIEDIQKFYSNTYNLNNSSLHFGDIYGPKDSRDKLIPYLLKNENNKEIKFDSDGKAPFTPLFIDDAIESIQNEIFTKTKNNFNSKLIASELMTVEDFIRDYKTIRGKKFKCIFSSIESKKYSPESFLKPENIKIPLSEGLLKL